MPVTALCLVDVVPASTKPIVAAVNGAAVGIGIPMILPFDVIVASDLAKLGMLFVKVGLVPELASTHLLVQRMGFGRASEMRLSGRLYGGAEAHAAGLVDVLTTVDTRPDFGGASADAGRGSRRDEHHPIRVCEARCGFEAIFP